MMRNKIRNYIKEKRTFLKEEILSNHLIQKEKKENNYKFCVNSIPTNINVFRIRTKEEVNEYLENNYFDNYYEGYVLPIKLDFDTMNYISEVDVVICNLSWEVIELHHFVKPNTIFKKLKKTSHIIVFCKNTITYIGLKLNDKLTPF